MGCFELTETAALFRDGERVRVLIDFTDFLANKSRLPLLGKQGENALNRLLAALAEEASEEDMLLLCLLAGIHMASPGPKKLLLVGFEKAGVELFRGLAASLHPLTTLTALEPSQLLERLGEDILFDLAILREGGLQSPEQALEKLNGLCRPTAPVLLSGKKDRLLSLLFSLNFGEPEEFLMREGFILAAFPQA